MEPKAKPSTPGQPFDSHVSSREIAFFSLQAVLPFAFTIVPVMLVMYFISPAIGLRRTIDGTIILIAFTMLISLSQDLAQSVKPYHRAIVSRLEMILRTGAILMLGVFAAYQTISILLLYRDTQCDSKDANCLARLAATHPDNQEIQLVELSLTIFAVYCFIIAFIACRRALVRLRPHFMNGR